MKNEKEVKTEMTKENELKKLIGSEVKIKTEDDNKIDGTIIGFKDDQVVVDNAGTLMTVKFENVLFKKNDKKEINKEIKDVLNSIDFVDKDGIVPYIITGIKKNMIIALRGKTGTGKTVLIQELAKYYNKELVILNMNCNTTSDEVKGKFALNEEGKLDWIQSKVVEAMIKGYWLVMEEANFMSEEISSVFYSLLDFRRNLVIDEHKGEVVNSHPDFRIFLTYNPNYEGTSRMNDAIANRISMYLDIDYLSPSEEGKLLKKRYSKAKPKDITVLCKIADKIRKDDTFRHLSTRTLENTCKLLEEGYSFKEAIGVTMINTLADDDVEKKKIMEIVNLHYKDDDAYESLKDISDRFGKEVILDEKN